MTSCYDNQLNCRLGFLLGRQQQFRLRGRTARPGYCSSLLRINANSSGDGRIQAPVLGLYGGDDARVNRTIPSAETAMAGLGKNYQNEIYAGAGHGFLRAQEAREGANLRASEQAWPRTISFLKSALGE